MNRLEASAKPEKVSTGDNPYREKFLDEKYTGIRKNEYEKTNG